MDTLQTKRRNSFQNGFTLVELLVVIGIISVLISILLPATRKAMDTARSLQCLSNLRQIAVAMQGYAADYKGAIVPCQAQIDQTNWNDWTVSLIRGKYLACRVYRGAEQATGEKNVLFCPEGIVEAGSNYFPNWQIPAPPTTNMNEPLLCYPLQSWAAPDCPGGVAGNDNWTWCWYSINGDQGWQCGTDGWLTCPSRTVPIRSVPTTDPNFSKYTAPAKLSQVRSSSELAFVFDGRGLRNASARHSRYQRTNVVFLDGHAESLPGIRKYFPRNWSGEYSMASLLANGQTFPKWRLDQ